MSRDLSELLVSLALGALVIAGALQMHTAFTRQGQRQQEVAEVQQTLRVAMRLVGAALRSAGAAGRVVEKDEGQCRGAPRELEPLEWSNGELRVIGARSSAPLRASGEGGGDLHVLSGDAAVLAAGDLFQVLGGDGVCTREVSAGAPRERAIEHDPARSSRCFNPAPATDRCLQRCTRERPCALRRLGGVSEFRVERGRLVTRRSAFGAAAAPWTSIADGVENLDVTFVCAAEGACDASHALAVRLTLTARGRSLTEVIALRNMSSSS